MTTTCPACHAIVAPMPDGKCPSCGEIIPTATPFSEPSKPESSRRENFRETTESSPAWSSPLNKRYEATHAADDENPYQTPKSNFPESNPLFNKDNDAQGSGLKWILLSFKGRIPRSTFWAAMIGLTVVSYGILIVFILIASSLAAEFQPANRNAFVEEPDVALIILIIGIPWAIVTMWIQFAIHAKRCHDRDKSGWWVLLQFIPYIGPLWAFIELGCLEGTIGNNQYGPDPIARNSSKFRR